MAQNLSSHSRGFSMADITLNEIDASEKALLAWYRGSDTVQYRDESLGGTAWYDLGPGNTQSRRLIYRMRPPSVRYRTALISCSNKTHTVLSLRDEEHAKALETMPYFVRWLHDWQEITP